MDLYSSASFSGQLLGLAHMRYLTNHADALRKAVSILSGMSTAINKELYNIQYT